MIFYILLTWILFIPVAFINGFFREKYLKKYTGETTAHQISTLILSAAFIAFAAVTTRSFISTLSNITLLLIGLSWVGLTILFEFGFGHYINKKSWEILLVDYNILKGRIWALFLLVELLSPFIIRGIL